MSDTNCGCFTSEGLREAAERCGPTHHDACPCVHRGYLLQVDAAREQRDAALAQAQEAIEAGEKWKARAEAAERRIREGTEAWIEANDDGDFRATLKASTFDAEAAAEFVEGDVCRVLILDAEPEATP